LRKVFIFSKKSKEEKKKRKGRRGYGPAARSQQKRKPTPKSCPLEEGEKPTVCPVHFTGAVTGNV